MFTWRQAMVTVKIGKQIAVIATLFSLGYAIGKVNKSKMICEVAQNSHKPTQQQYANRLIEFFDEDLKDAIQEYSEYIEMGFNPPDAFEIAKAKSYLC